MGLKEQLTNMSPREQRLLGILGAVFGAMLFLGLPIYVYTGLSEARERNEEIREVIRRMGKARELLAKRRSEPGPKAAAPAKAAASAGDA